MIKKKMVRVLTVAGLLACLASGCTSGGSSVGKEAVADEIKKGGFTVAASCHDPQIIREGAGRGQRNLSRAGNLQ